MILQHREMMIFVGLLNFYFVEHIISNFSVNVIANELCISRLSQPAKLDLANNEGHKLHRIILAVVVIILEHAHSNILNYK